MSKELSNAIGQWWTKLKAHLDVSDQELADLIEAQAWRTGAQRVQPVDRKNVHAWRNRGQFPPQDEFLQAAVMQLMEQMAQTAGTPQGAGPWKTAVELHQAWLASRAAHEDAPTQKTLEANARKRRRLSDALVDDPELTVVEATEPQHLGAGFLQGSWVTDDATPPHAPRVIDAILDERLGELARSGRGGLLLVVGPPKAGKTRTLLEALRRTVPERRLWNVRPCDGALNAITDAVTGDGGRSGAYAASDVVVLLDDLQRHNFHTVAGVTDRTLGSAIGSGVLIVATLHEDKLNQLQRYGWDHTDARNGSEVPIGATPRLLQMFSDARVDLSPTLTAEELSGIPKDLAAQLALHDFPPERLARLPELLAAVDALHHRALDGKSDRDRPERAAIISAGLAAHALYPAGASLGELEQLSHWAFQILFPTRHWDPNLFIKAFEWATTAIGGPGSVHAVFQPSNPEGNVFGIFDPLALRLDSGLHEYAWLWPHADQLTPQQCYYMYARTSGLDPESLRWLKRAAKDVPEAMTQLGALYQHLEQHDLAEKWYSKAASADATYPEPVLLLGTILVQQGKLAEAEPWILRYAYMTGAIDYLLLLAHGCRDQNDPDGQLRWTLMAARAGSHTAMVQLAGLYRTRGEPQLAEPWWRRVVASGYADQLYGRWCQPNEFQERNEEDLRTAASLSHPEAMASLAGATESEGTEEDTADLRARAAEPVASIDLLGRAAMHHARGETEEAKSWAERGAHMGCPESMVMFGYLSKESEKELWWREAAGLGLPLALCILGALNQQRGDMRRARGFFVEAANGYDLAAIRVLAGTAEDPQEAERWWLQGAELFDPDAMWGLALHYLEAGERSLAKLWLERISSRKPSAMPILGMLHQEDGDSEGAAHWLERAGKDPLAIAVRGAVDWGQGQQESAQEWWGVLPTLDHKDLAHALHFVGDYLLRAGEPDRAEMWLLLAAELNHTASKNLLSDLHEDRGEPEL